MLHLFIWYLQKYTIFSKQASNKEKDYFVHIHKFITFENKYKRKV